MSKIDVRFEGLYDIRTMMFLKGQGLFNFSFDFRAKSFNFLQQYRFLEILEKSYNKNCIYFLQYQNERDFVIQKMLDDLKLNWSGRCNLHEQFFLEFSDNQELNFYQQFDFPFYWHFQDRKDINELIKSNNLKGLVFNSKFFEEYINKGSWYGFLQSLFTIVPNIKMILSTDFDFILSLAKRSINIELMGIDLLSFAIDSNVEVCYRNVNLYKLRDLIINLPKELAVTSSLS